MLKWMGGQLFLRSPSPLPPPASAWAERVVSIITELFAITFKHFCLDLLGGDGLIFLLLAFRCFMFGLYQTSKGLAAGNTSRYTLIFILKALNLFFKIGATVLVH